MAEGHLASCARDPWETLCLLRVPLAPESPKDRKGSLGIVTETFEIR